MEERKSREWEKGEVEGKERKKRERGGVYVREGMEWEVRGGEGREGEARKEKGTHTAEMRRSTENPKAAQTKS